jgi:prevent-host-death family protein
MLITAEVGSRQLDDLIKQVQAGDEVLLTQEKKPVAKLISVVVPEASTKASFQIRSFQGHRVLTPNISQGELAEELFGRQ